MSKKLSDNYRKKFMTRLLPLFCILAGGAAAAYFVNAEQYKQKYLPGTVIDGINAGEMTPEELAEVLVSDALDYDLTLKFLNDVTEEIDGSDISLSYNILPELQEIHDSQNRFAWILGMYGNHETYTTVTPVTFDADELEAIIDAMPELSPENIREPENARLKMNANGMMEIVPEVNGNYINADELYDQAGAAVVSRETFLDLVTADGIYEKPEILSTDEELIANKDSLNAFLGTTVTHNLSSGGEMVLDRAETSNWLDVDEDGGYGLSEESLREHAADYIKTVAAKDDNYGYYREFRSTYFGIVKMGTEALHGHRIDQEAMTEELVQDLTAHKDAIHEMTYAEVVDNKDPQFGGTYVEVDILNQHVFFYIDYELYYECDCVSGLEGSHSTPSGIFSIIEKENGRTLEGYNSDGTVSYTAFVNYWMCFYPHYGLHDASWRDSFGGETYLWDGSHGCVNLSQYSAGKIFNAIDYDTPVIVFRGQDDYEVPEDEISPNTEDSIAN